MIKRNFILAALLSLPALPLAAQSFLSDSQSTQAREAGKGDPDYQKGLSALDSRDWDQAVTSFSASADRKGSNADSALYWLAYAQNRDGDDEEALSTLKRLSDGYPSSRWLKDARALAVEIKTRNGNSGSDNVSTSSEPDQDLKLLALNSLMNSDPNKAMPILRKILFSNNSDAIKDRAMFVLVQNPSPEGQKTIDEIARGNNPDLQMKAIRYMGMMGNDGSRKELADIYHSTSSENVKKAVLHSLMTSGSRDLLLSVAKTETNPELRRTAIHQLAITGGKDELWQLYQQENTLENKKAILESMFLTGDSSKVAEIARSAKEPELRMAAIHSLGLMGQNANSDVLLSIYKSDSSLEVREAVLNALFIQQNAKLLIQLARAEKDPHMKQKIVQKPSLIQSKETTDYMLEILK